MVWIVAISVGTFLLSLWLVWICIVHLPQDYLVREHSVIRRRFANRPILRAILLAAKNGLGLLLVAAGLVMLITPGQGLLTVFLGLTLLDFPGKQRVVNRLLSRGKVIRAINRIRARADRPPLELPNSAT